MFVKRSEKDSNVMFLLINVMFCHFMLFAIFPYTKKIHYK